jgi:hypothetical protein
VPAVSLSATLIDFGPATWMQAAPTQNLVVTNTGDAPLAIQTVDISGEPYAPQDFMVFLNQCFYQTLAPGARCQISIRFTPQSGGPRSAKLTIWDNAAESPQQVSLKGLGTGAVIRFFPQALDFGTVPAGATSPPLTFTTVNAGDAAVTISQASLAPAPWYSTWFAVTRDGCTGATLGPGQRCTISATASPAAVGNGSQIINIVDNAGTGRQTYTGLNVNGGGPLAGFYPTFPTLNQGVGTTSAASPVRVFDAGTQPLLISTVALDNSGAGFSIAHDGCSGVLLPVNTPNATPTMCEIDLVFAPPAVGSLSANLVVRDNELGGSHTLALTSNGYAPVAVPSPTAIDFGFQAVGIQTAPQVVTLRNPSPQALTVTSVGFSGANASIFKLTSDSCSNTTVAPGGSCSVGVAFTAPFAYLFAATLSFTDNATSSPPIPQTVSLRGEGQAQSFIVSTSYLNFGDQKARVISPSKTITVTNISAGTLNLGLLPAYPLSGSGCSAPVAAGASCTVSASVTPPGVGAQTALFKVFDGANYNNQQAVQVDWNGTTGATFIEGPLAFGSIVQKVGTSLATSGSIRNGGTAGLNVGQIYLSNNPPAAITSDNCSNQSLAPGANCILTVTASPTTVGAWYTTLTVPTDAAVGPNPATLFIRGLSGPPAQPVFSPASVSFAAQNVGAPESTQIVWLDNGLVPAGGAQSLTISSVALGGPDARAFRIVWDGCSGLKIDAAYSCPVSVGFDPNTGRMLAAFLLFNDDASGSPQAVSLSGVGLAPGASLSTSKIDFGSVVVNTKSATATVTLTSAGNLTLNIGQVTLSGLNKGDYTITSENCQFQSLAPGSTCQVTIGFRPEAVGARIADLTLTDNALNSPQSVSLTGTGVSK